MDTEFASWNDYLMSHRMNCAQGRVSGGLKILNLVPEAPLPLTAFKSERGKKGTRL